jgi:16S rRNA (adenine1518-N6/adenine1519-N6)-dimethyltransferase
VSATLPTLRQVVETYGLMAKKSLGQHFLLDQNITDKIVRKAGDLSGCNVIEIGPGPGGLTRSLLFAGAKSVVAIERDDRAVAALHNLQTQFMGRLTIIADDALSVDVIRLTEAPRAIVANLPYNIGTQLLLNWLDQIAEDVGAFESLTLMFQKEVAERLTAQPRSKAYGRLSVFAQWLCEVHDQMDVPASVFVPPPKVDSRVVTLIPRKNRTAANKQALETIVQMAFGQRRKMLRAALKSIPDIETKLLSIGIAPTARAEEIDVAGFCKMAGMVNS